MTLVSALILSIVVLFLSIVAAYVNFFNALSGNSSLQTKLLTHLICGIVGWLSGLSTIILAIVFLVKRFA
jgi:hypothetical protein